MKLSNTIFRSKFDEDDDEERLLIDELLPQGKENLFENAIFRSKFDEDDDDERLLIDDLFPLNIMLLGKSLIMQLNRCIFLHFQNFLWLVSFQKKRKLGEGHGRELFCDQEAKVSTNIKALQLVKDKMGSSPNNVLRNLVVLIRFMDNNYWINSFKLCKIPNKNEIPCLEEKEIGGELR